MNGKAGVKDRVEKRIEILRSFKKNLNCVSNRYIDINDEITRQINWGKTMGK